MWIVVGASAGLGRALAEELARQGHSLLLSASDARDLTPLAADLGLRYRVPVAIVAQDAADVTALGDALADARSKTEEIDGLMFALGHSRDGDDGLLPASESERLVHVNFLSVVSVVTRFLPELLEKGRGEIIGFGSVAATRGRSRNVVYAASKRALESYFESLRHVAEPRGVHVSFWVLGFLDTNLSFGEKLLLPAASPSKAAKHVCRRLAARAGRRFFPRAWRPVTNVVRSLPWFIFRRLRF